jgi:hypothetical protein
MIGRKMSTRFEKASDAVDVATSKVLCKYSKDGIGIKSQPARILQRAVAKVIFDVNQSIVFQQIIHYTNTAICRSHMQLGID